MHPNRSSHSVRGFCLRLREPSPLTIDLKASAVAILHELHNPSRRCPQLLFGVVHRSSSTHELCRFRLAARLLGIGHCGMG
ncbi:hypothetical protein BST61_g6967 [Cercospora zeina]